MRILYLTSIKGVQFKAFLSVAESSGHVVHLIGGKQDYRAAPNITFHEPNGTIIRLTKYLDYLPYIGRKYSLSLNHAVKQVIKRVKPECIHAIGANSWGVLAASCNSGSWPLVITCQGSDIYRFPFKHKKNFSEIKSTFQKADLIHVLSKSSSLYVADLFQIDPDKIWTSYWGIDIDEIDQIMANTEIDFFKQSHGIHKEDVVLFLPRGMRTVFRPIISFIHSIAPLLKQKPHIKVIIMMHGNDEKMKKEINSVVHSHGVGKNFIYIDEFQPHTKMIKYFLSSDIMVSIAENDETCSAILEAMYCGVVPIISRTPTYQDRFCHEKNVFFIDNQELNTSKSLLSNVINNISAIKSHMIPSNKKIIKNKFSRNINLIKIQNLYEMAVDRKHNQ